MRRGVASATPAVLSLGPVLRFLHGRLTYANITATLALFVSLGGASYAAVTLPAASVGKKQIRAGAVSLGALSFPLGTTGITDDEVEDLTKNGCNGGSFPGNATAVRTPSNPGSSGGQLPAATSSSFRSAGRLRFPQ